MLPILRGCKRNNMWHTSCCLKSTIKTPQEIASCIIGGDGKRLDHLDLKNETDINKICSDVIREYPEEPTTCCMSGCPNCVWIDYADKISAYFKDGGEKAMQEIDEKVSDSNIKAFLMHELRTRNKFKPL